MKLIYKRNFVGTMHIPGRKKPAEVWSSVGHKWEGVKVGDKFDVLRRLSFCFDAGQREGTREMNKRITKRRAGCRKAGDKNADSKNFSRVSGN